MIKIIDTIQSQDAFILLSDHGLGGVNWENPQKTSHQDLIHFHFISL